MLRRSDSPTLRMAVERIREERHKQNPNYNRLSQTAPPPPLPPPPRGDYFTATTPASLWQSSPLAISSLSPLSPLPISPPPPPLISLGPTKNEIDHRENEYQNQFLFDAFQAEMTKGGGGVDAIGRGRGTFNPRPHTIFPQTQEKEQATGIKKDQEGKKKHKAKQMFNKHEHKHQQSHSHQREEEQEEEEQEENNFLEVDLESSIVPEEHKNTKSGKHLQCSHSHFTCFMVMGILVLILIVLLLSLCGMQNEEQKERRKGGKEQRQEEEEEKEEEEEEEEEKDEREEEAGAARNSRNRVRVRVETPSTKRSKTKHQTSQNSFSSSSTPSPPFRSQQSRGRQAGEKLKEEDSE